MALKKRTMIDRVHISRDGSIQVTSITQIYDTLAEVEDGMTDVEMQTSSRVTIAQGDKTPADVQAFIDASRAS